MDENMSHAISLMGATLLFMVAFSCSVIFYNGLGDRADEFFAVNSIAGRREDATLVVGDRSDNEREIAFEEVYLAILNLPSYVSGNGNISTSKIEIKDRSGNLKGTYTASYDIDTNIKKVILSDSSLHGEYDLSSTAQMKTMLKDFCALALPGASLSASNSNQILMQNKDLINNTNFSIKYENDTITYTLN